MESILELDDKKVFIYNILQDYSSNTKLMNDILQIVDKYKIVHTENGNGIFLNLSKINDIIIINEIFMIVQSFNYTQNIQKEDDNLYIVTKKTTEKFQIDEKIKINNNELRLLEFFKNI